MSWTYESAYLSGYTTGTTGLKIYGTLTFFVSGLKYDGTGISVYQSRFFTGYAMIGSGDISTPVSGNLVYYSDDNLWRADLAVLDQSAAGELATGLFELYWNTGVINASTGWEDATGFIRIFGNPDLDAWNILSYTDGVKHNADAQHTHAAYAQYLRDLDDVSVPATPADNDALVWFAASGGWTTGAGGGDPDDWDAVSGEVAEITGTVSDYVVFSGAFSTLNTDYPVTSGAVADYPAVSGSYAGHIVDDDAHHAVFEPGDKYTDAEAVQATEDAGLILSASKSINIDGTPADATYTGIVLDINTDGCATYDAVYVDGLNSVAPADATDISKMPAIGVVVAANKVLVLGVIRNDAAWAISAADKVYVDDTTAGELVNTIAGLNQAGNIIQIMGVAVGNDMLYISPSLDWAEFVA